MFDTASFEASQIDLWVMESNAFVKSTVAAHSGPHFVSPLVAFLLNHFVRRKMICCLV